MNIDQVCREIETALNLKQNTLNKDSSSSDVEEWDSVGHIYLMMHLDTKFNDVTKDKPQYMTAVSVKDLYEAGLKDL